MNKDNSMAYLFLAEDMARTAEERTLLIDPIVRKEMKIPGEFSFCICSGFTISNDDLETLVIQILTPEDEVLLEVDIKEMYFEGEGDYTEDGKRKDKLVATEVGLTSSRDERVWIESSGLYSLRLLKNGSMLGESFFSIGVESDGE